MSRRWTDEEIFYLQESWGKVSLPQIAKNLGRSENAVLIKVSRYGMSAFLNSGDYISFNQLMLTLFGRMCDSYQSISWVKNRNFPIRKKRVKNCSFKIVYIEEFWKWAEENRSFVDFSRLEEGALGLEPDWVKEQRKNDLEERFIAEPRVWTDAEDSRLEMYLKTGNYTVYEISRAFARTSGAIQKRIKTLNIPLTPVKSSAERYTQEDIDFITSGIKSGMSYIVMAYRLMRSDKALRGLVFNNYLTEDLDKVRKMIGDGKFYDGTPEPKVYQGVCLSRYRASVKKELSKLAGLLKLKINELGYEPYWQRFMCKHWDDFKGCLKEQSDCDSCTFFERIREQYCARCGETFFERKDNRFCEKCRVQRKKKARRKWRRENG